MDSTTRDTGSTNHPIRDTSSLVLVWVLCISIIFFLFLNAWAIRFIRQRIRNQDVLPASPERAESPTRWYTMASLRTQGQSGPSQLGYQPHVLSSPERITIMPSDSSNDTERRDGQHSVAAGNMASFSYTPSETEEQLPKYMGRDHDLPDYTDQSAIPAA